jgi:hypothetical protein
MHPHLQNSRKIQTEISENPGLEESRISIINFRDFRGKLSEFPEF